MSLRWLVLLGGALLLATPARALTTSLTLDPSTSSLLPEAGAAEGLSGTLTLAVGALPVAGAATSFDVIDLALTATGGSTIGLDPTAAAPGLGVLHPDGSFLIPTLFLRLAGGTTVPLALPDVMGEVVFGPGGASLLSLATAFAVDAGPPAGLVSVTVNAVVPEPGTLGLLAAGLATLALARRQLVEDLR